MNGEGPKKLLDYLTLATDFLAARDVENARLNAERMLASVLDIERLQLYLQFDRPLEADEVTRYREFLRRRGKGEPLQYILGTAEFYGRMFEVTPAVLIPRPETEVLVETAIDRLKSIESPSVADVGTGSGCIAITLAAEIPDAEIHATDISSEALDIARGNAELNGVEGRVRWREGDLLTPLRGVPLAAVVCNLPYVSESDRGTLQREVRDWEPERALFAGDDGLSVVRRFIPQAADAVLPGGFVAMEIGAGQADEVARLWQEAAPEWGIELVKDLAGIDRVVVASKPGAPTQKG